MKTLDEVIEAVRVCSDTEIECYKCPYGKYHRITGDRLACFCIMFEDVLHYLEEYNWMDKALDPSKRGRDEDAR